MSVGDCIAVYLSLSACVFRKTRHRVTEKAQVQGQFEMVEGLSILVPLQSEDTSVRTLTSFLVC
jgi:hypothetical protein